ncbi:MAG: tRNA (guanine-N7)-methyltransferase [Polyangiaceae bacterium]|nr:tRNA (guanine-N7)-methyltransferase [Polyangiaceae bacterium]
MVNDPYAHCPRLPEEGQINLDELFSDPPVDQVSAPKGPIELEIGPGRGWFTIERLEAEPQVRVIGLEIRRKWATIVDERVKERGLGHRGRIFAEDARLTLPRFPENSLGRVYVHFPDPWWKKRHEKRLVLTSSLLDTLTRLLIPGGELFVQTDVAERGDQYQAVLDDHAAFEPVAGGPRIADHEFIARSPRERKAIEYELPIVRLLYRNKKS